MLLLLLSPVVQLKFSRFVGVSVYSPGYQATGNEHAKFMPLKNCCHFSPVWREGKVKYSHPISTAGNRSLLMLHGGLENPPQN